MANTLTTDKPKKGRKPKKSISRYIEKKLHPIERNIMQGYVNPYLDSQMQLAENRNIKEGEHNGPLDAIRHAGSAAGTTTEVFPSWVPTPLKVIGSNILGAAHEFSTPGKINWKETRSDLYNNFIGSVIGALPISNYRKQQMVIDAQNNGILSNVGEEPIREKPLKSVKFPKNETGGWLDKYADGGMQEYQENYNDNTTSYPEGFVGMGYDTTGRDYSPAWGGQFQLGGKLSKAQKGKKVIIDDKEYDVDSQEYKDMLDKGLVGTMEGDRFWGNKSTLKPIVIYNSKDKGTQEFYDKLLKNEDNDVYASILELGKRYGSPYVSLKDKAGWFDAKYHEDSPNANEFRPSFNPITGNINLGSNSKDLIEDYISELAHRKQWLDKGFTDFQLRGIKQLPRIIKNKLDVNKKGYEEEYDIPGSIEYEAHTDIEPMLRDEYMDLLFNKDMENDYYKFPGTFSDSKPAQTYKSGGQFAMGGSIPGAVGFTYARTAGAAPSNGPYAKKTKASAENGTEMSYYQNGLDWKPKSISKNGSGIPKNQNAKFSLPSARDLARQMVSASESTSTGTPKKDAKVMDELAKKKEFDKYIGSQPQLKKATKSTPESEARRKTLNKQYITGLPNAAYDEQSGDVSRINPNRSVTGEAENFMSRREDKAAEHIGKALEVAGYLEGAGAIAKGFGSILKPAGKWTKELVQGSIAARKPKLPEFVTALRTEPVGFNPSAVAPHPSLNPTQQTFTGSWIQNASKRNPSAFDETLAYVSGPERKAAGDLQLLSEVIPWSKAQKITGKNLPFDAKTMSFGAGKYGSLENALKEGAISNKEFTLLKNYNTQASRIAGSPNLSSAMDQTIARLRANPELYNANEMLSPQLASTLRASPVAVGSADVIASSIQGLKNAALENKFILNPIKEGIRETGQIARKELIKEGAIHEAKDHLKKGGVIVDDDLGQWAHPGQVTRINSNRITMKGVPYPVLGISDKGDRKMMYPEQEYTFKGKTVTEYPQKKKGGWLEKYN